MKKLSIAALFAFAFVSTSAHAGKIEIKKAKRNAKEATEKAMVKARKSCGNAGLAFRIEWAGADTISDAALKKAGRTRVNAYKVFGSLTAYVAQSIESICKDKDYRAELKKIRLIRFISPKSLETKFKPKKAGTTINAYMPLVNASAWSTSKGKNQVKNIF
jgi:hypothetical protein